jgi:hypothetical protein
VLSNRGESDQSQILFTKTVLDSEIPQRKSLTDQKRFTETILRMRIFLAPKTASKSQIPDGKNPLYKNDF